MGQIVQWAEGETAPRDFPLTDNGVAFDLTGGPTLSLVLHAAGEVLVSNPGTVAVQDAAGGVVRFTPASASILEAKKSPYRARFKVVKTGQDYYFPNDERGDTWRVGKQ
jgi:hypothetical protein